MKRTAVGVVAILLLSSCAVKTFTKPRSQVVAEARAKGVVVPTDDEEQKLFQQHDTEETQKLLALIEKRSSPDNQDSSYRLGAGDHIEINVFDVPELNVTAPVRESGFITLPLVGAVKAAGLTESEFHDELRKRLGTYVRNPQLNVFVTQYASQKVAVVGAVHTPGTYALKKGENSILELISRAGGLTEKAGGYLEFIPSEETGVAADNDADARAKLALASQDVNVKRAGIEVPVDRVMGTSGGLPIDIPVRGGDMIIIPDAGRVMVEGEVEKGGSYDLGNQTTLLAALAAAGGITYSAKVDEVEVIRDLGPNQRAHLVLDLQKVADGEQKDVRLKNGDIVRVPSDTSRKLRQETFDSISRVINLGVGGNVNLVH